MLYEIAKLYDGMFGYIPDAQNVGTTFVNGIANMLTTYATNVWLKLKWPEKTNCQIKNIHCGDMPLQIHKNKNGCTIGVGSVRYGQGIDILVEWNGPQG